MEINIVAAMDKNKALGIQGKLLCRLTSDLLYFKRLTQHHAVLMGRKTYESIGRALPHRQNIILTRQTDFSVPGCDVVASFDEAIAACQHDKMFIIGGGEIYQQFLPLAQTLYLTHIHHHFKEADTFFPEFDLAKWQVTSEERHNADEKNDYDFSFATYQKLNQ